jgi:hypothetical protein
MKSTSSAAKSYTAHRGRVKHEVEFEQRAIKEEIAGGLNTDQEVLSPVPLGDSAPREKRLLLFIVKAGGTSFEARQFALVLHAVENERPSDLCDQIFSTARI